MTRPALLAAAALATAGLVSAPAPALAADRAAPGVSTCTDEFFGGTFYCGGEYENGKPLFEFGNGTREIFVIGTDRAAWTRWTNPGGGLSRWTTLDGYSTTRPTLVRQGRDDVGMHWQRDRNAAGRWSAWHH
ncbi:hypothetical protein [Kitasatospora sp. NPDC085879]|uniref:hypothetical protein n=1 Tax=Kitasatospora sp. NPDC085879 TaxID=3154769 RepID=UPI003412E345